MFSPSVLLLVVLSSYGQALNNTAYDIQYPLGFEADALTWLRPNGCAVQSMPGQQEISCLLPSGEIVLTVAANSVSLRCEDETFNCNELSEVQKHIDNHTDKPNMRVLTIDNCVLPDEEVSCVLSLVGARDASVLIFKDLRSNLTQRHLVGLERVTDFQIRGLYNATEVPYDAMSALPTLNRVLIKDASLRLTNKTGAILPIRRLSLLDVSLNAIPGGAFKRTPFLDNLMIVGQKHRLDIDENAFDDLPHLVNISLNSNNIQSLPERVFSKNKLLENIDLYVNALTTLHPSVFSGLTRLTEINIFGNVKNMKFENGLFSNLPSLKLVDVHQTFIGDLPENFFSNSTDIKRIDMSECNLTALPENVFLNLNLEHLDLSANGIEALPAKVFYGQNKLIQLNLSENKIKLLPGDLFNTLANLKILNMANNFIEDLNDYLFENLSSLEELHLNYNNLKELRSRTFNTLRRLKVLSLSHNSIVQYSEAIPSLLDLNRLDLSHNGITTVYDVWFPLVYLDNLDLSYNYITELDRVNLDSRTRVDLRYNNITYVDLLLPEKSPDSLPDLLLDNNPFNCNCSLYNFLSLTNNKSFTRIHINEAKCSTPNDLSGHKLINLSLDMLTCVYPICPDECVCIERISKKQIEFNCNSLPDFVDIQRSPMNTVLRLENYTYINGLPSYVKFLNVSGLNITNFESIINYPIDIDLSGNALTEAPIILNQNVTINLSNNPFNCDCEHRDSVTLLKMFYKKIHNYPQLTCDNGDYIETKDIDQICTLKSQVAYSLIALVVVCCLCVVLFFAYRNLVIIRILLRKYGFQLNTDLGDYDYDAFVSFANEDSRVVDVIVKKLESGTQPLKLCVHTRNWIPGEMIVDQIERSVERSRWTIIVLSRSFVKSYWAKIEYLTAHSKSKLLVLILDDVHESESLSTEIKLYIKSTTYTHYNNPYAVERLRDAILRKPRSGIVKCKGVDKLNGLDVRINVDGQLVNTAQKY